MDVSTPRPASPTPGKPVGSPQATPHAAPHATSHTVPHAGVAKCPKCGGILDMKTKKCQWCVNPVTPDSTLKKKTLPRPSIPVIVLGLIGVICITWGVLLPPELTERPGTLGTPPTTIETANPSSIVLFIIGIGFVAASGIKYYRDTQ